MPTEFDIYVENDITKIAFTAGELDLHIRRDELIDEGSFIQEEGRIGHRFRLNGIPLFILPEGAGMEAILVYYPTPQIEFQTFLPSENYEEIRQLLINNRTGGPGEVAPNGAPGGDGPNEDPANPNIGHAVVNQAGAPSHSNDPSPRRASRRTRRMRKNRRSHSMRRHH